MSITTRVLSVALALVIALSGWLYISLGEAKKTAALAQARAEAKEQTITDLRASMGITDKAVGNWAKDRTTLANVRSATEAAVKEAMRDESYRVWASGPVHPDAWRMLEDLAAGAGLGPAPGGAFPAGTGNTDPAKRDKR